MTRLAFFLTTALLFSISISLTAQNLYMPRDVKQAYKNGARSMDGRPGKNYWQNHARYTIAVTATPPDRNIQGTETISYINNSPDTLRNPNIKLFLNIHRAGAPRDAGATDDYLTSGVHIDECKVNGQTIQVRTDPYVFTNLSIKLPQPLLPHDSVQLSFSWHYQISLRSGREGMIDSTTYFMAYFYPRVAVFDDYNGTGCHLLSRMSFIVISMITMLPSLSPGIILYGEPALCSIPKIYCNRPF
jgi:hypothetical protein